MEAMACGCVPILPTVGGAHEYAEHGVNALLVDTNDTNAIISAAVSLITGNHSLPEMRAAGIVTAQRFSIEESSARTYQLFKFVSDHWTRSGVVPKGRFAGSVRK
jgi:glycosyltransferase involved in cell wall biosynthesis